MGAFYAKNLAELESLIMERPDESPSVFLPDDSLAAFYYDRYTLRDLRRFFEGDPDLELCADFGVNTGQWRESVMMALFAKKVMKRRQEQ